MPLFPALTAVALRDRVKATVSEGMAAANSPEREHAAGHGAMMTYCLGRVCGTRRGKTAAAAGAK